ncbi:HSP20-like chaperone [Thelephora terrestris]|uniref:HSP20-like chaperone n=1 Tax=Thelephora terrestris TaxID=56493 RepID=A0A9P6HH54_9AGAM|nr:HSP20-like chaperone [Thelephora terrestris]
MPTDALFVEPVDGFLTPALRSCFELTQNVIERAALDLDEGSRRPPRCIHLPSPFNVVWLTVNLPDINRSTLEYKLTSSKISFKARTGNAKQGVEENEYAFDMELFGEVIPEESKMCLSSRSFSLSLRKKEKKLEFWPRLTKVEQKSALIKKDFSTWVEEDEQDASLNFDLGMGGAMMDCGGGQDFAKLLGDLSGSGLRSGLSSLAADADSDDEEDDM